MPQTAHKLENPIFAQLAEDRLQASFIADGIHLHPSALKVLLRAKGLNGAILVTDAVSGAAAAPGQPSFCGHDDRADASRRRSACPMALLAGSALCLDQAVRNLVSWGLATAEEALALASTMPLALLAPALAAHGLQRRTGEVSWSAELAVETVRLGPVERHYRTGNTLFPMTATIRGDQP